MGMRKDTAPKRQTYAQRLLAADVCSRLLVILSFGLRRGPRRNPRRTTIVQRSAAAAAAAVTSGASGWGEGCDLARSLELRSHAERSQRQGEHPPLQIPVYRVDRL
jgi:hypothetical protein